MAGNGRVLDRRRMDCLLGEDEGSRVLAALSAYSNGDGGYGLGLEPDLRSAVSQPVGAMHALEVFAEVTPPVSKRAVELCDWLAEHTLADGGLPFALPVPDPAGTSPIWLGADPGESSLQMTTQVADHAHRLARHESAIADHPWLAAATSYCLQEIRAIDEAPNAYALMFSLRFLDAAAEVPGADEALEQLGRFVPADGTVAVSGGSEGEKLYALDLSPRPDSRSRRLFNDGVTEAALERLVSLQQEDGGWTIDFETSSPAAALEWRGVMTVAAVATLLAHGFDS